jgi:hypothetical protein
MSGISKAATVGSDFVIIGGAESATGWRSAQHSWPYSKEFSIGVVYPRIQFDTYLEMEHRLQIRGIYLCCIMYMYICILYVYIRVNMSVSRKAEIDWRSVGRRVREIRGFDDNQEVFSRALGVSQGQLSRYERGESEIGAAVLLRLARKSRKTIEWLLTGDQTLKNVRDEGRKG